MSFTQGELKKIFCKVHYNEIHFPKGKCYHCDREINFYDYGKSNASKSWEVDHGNPTSRGGVDDLRNYHASCISCNRAKSSKTTSEFK